MNLLPLWREFFPAKLWLSDPVKDNASDAFPQRYFGMKYKEDDAMKRKLLLFCTAIFLICFFSGCVVLPGNNTSDSDGSKIPGGSSVTPEPDGAEQNDISLDALQKKIITVLYSNISYLFF